MNRRPPNFLIRVLLPAALLLALVPACGRNKPGTLLAPTGLRPAPAVWPGSLTGNVIYDPRNTPDLASAPYPPTIVDLFLGSTKVGSDTMDTASNQYLFQGLAPGSYSIVARSTFFLANSRGGLPVREGQLDAGNITLTVDPTKFSNSIDLIGSMPNYEFAWLGSGYVSFLQNSLGVWTFNDVDNLAGPPPAIAAGTYRMKFVNSFASTQANLVGWGWSATDTLQTPIVMHPTVLASGPSTDIVVRFPVGGTYAFTLDERRQVFTIQLATAATAPARLARR